MNKYILAMYDVAGKQEYIFRQPTIKQIVGASNIISDVFKDYLYPAAREYCETNKDVIYDYQNNPSVDFTVEGFKKHLDEGYVGEVVYEGGGNFIVLYKDSDTCININKIFTKNLLEKTYSLRVLCTYVDVDLTDDKITDFNEDRRRLYEKHIITQNEETFIRPVNVMPFVQVEKETSLPLSDLNKFELDENKKKVSREGIAKHKKYKEVVKNEYGEKILDNLVYCKGEDSLLSVIFIDGNNMGAKVQQCLQGMKTYEECVKKLRSFSNDIQKNYVDDRVKDITEALYDGSDKDKAAELMRRMVVFAGDEMSFIVSARDSLKAIEAYFKNLPDEDSSCAGVAIFHSHAPYSEAYKIAEECCESGKQRMKHNKETNTCYIDFQYCQSGLGMDLETIRKREVGNVFISKPWLIRGESNDPNTVTLTKVNRVVEDLNMLGSRTNIKTLANVAKSSLTEFDMEMERIYAHQSSDIQEKINYTFKELKGDERRKLIYDIVIVYDLWFRGKEA